MASLALLVSIIFLFTILIGPITYLLARLNFPTFIIYILGLLSIVIGVYFCFIPIPLWYIGLVPIYCGYTSIRLANKKESEG